MFNHANFRQFTNNFLWILLVAIVASGCSSDPVKEKDGTKKEGKLTVTVQLRDEATGERSRTLKTDEFGIIREVEIAFRDNSNGVRLHDDSGKLATVKIRLPDGDLLEGTVDATGKTVVEARRIDGQGNIRTKVRYNKTKGTTVESYGSNNQLQLKSATDAAGKTVSTTVYHDDGKTVKVEWAGEIYTRKSLKLYSPEGKLVYEDKPVTGVNKYGEYSAIIYDPTSGKAKHNLSINEGPYDTGGGRLMSVTDLDADGKETTVRTFDPYDWENSRKFPLLPNVAGMEDLIKTKRSCWDAINYGLRFVHSIKYNLGRVMAD